MLIDSRVNCCSIITTIKIKDYLSLVESTYKNRGGIEGQRDPLKTTTAIRIRKRMIEDLKIGAILPPVVMGVIVPESTLSEIKDKIDLDITQIISKSDRENISIIDGMQRTTAMVELGRSFDFLEREMWVEYWIASSINSLIYRMLILNTGQVPWNLRRQIEVTFRSMIKELKDKVPNLELYEMQTGKRRTKSGQFQANDLIELYLVFGARKEKIDTKERLADEFTRLDFIEATEIGRASCRERV